jgi:hypothetical protein
MIDHVSANAPGRTEGRCEHTDLSINTDSTIATALFDQRSEHTLRSLVHAMIATALFATRSAHTSSSADATAAMAAAASRREPQPSRVGLLPGPAGRFARSSRRAMSTRCWRPCTKTRHDTRTAVECTEHATRKAIPAVARRYRAHCRRSSDLSTRRGRPCARSRDANEHGRRAHRPRG